MPGSHLMTYIRYRTLFGRMHLCARLCLPAHVSRALHLCENWSICLHMSVHIHIYIYVYIHVLFGRFACTCQDEPIDDASCFQQDLSDSGSQKVGTFTDLSMFVSSCQSLSICLSADLCICIYEYIQVHTCVHVRTYLRVCVCVSVLVYLRSKCLYMCLSYRPCTVHIYTLHK